MYDITMSTIHRDKNQYLFDTLKSLSLSTQKELYPLYLVVGNPDINYLKDYTGNIIPITNEEWDLVKDKGKCDKFNLNFYRCLTSQRNPNTLGRLYLEDDLLFKNNWIDTLDKLIISTKEHIPEFALSIYSPYDLSASPTDLVEFDRGFYGTQGVFFTSGIIEKFADKIMQEGILNYRHMADILLQEFCIENNIPLLVVKNSLVQHIGVESSIHNNTFHKSVSF